MKSGLKEHYLACAGIREMRYIPYRDEKRTERLVKAPRYRDIQKSYIPYRDEKRTERT